MKLLYSKNTIWEYSFITKDILFNIEELEIETFEKKDFNLLLGRTDIINNNILVINTEYNINDVINVIKYIQPIIIFYMSDEYGNNSNMKILENHTKLLFRQYNHSHYNYSNNNYQLPLGYVTNFLSEDNSFSIHVKDINERKINCSFIGAVKSDRLHMTNIFKKYMKNTNITFVKNNWNINNLAISPKKCFDVYNNSIFVICGRGNVNLDCFRIYEAIVAGAIPIVVGSIDEISKTFNYNNNIPPFVHDDSWEKVVIKCNNLLNDLEQLQKIQNELLKWWNNQLLFINNLIKEEIMKR